VPLPPPSESPLWAVGARRASPPGPDRAALIASLRRLAGESDALVAVFDARAIAGERHLLSAWAHLGRSRNRAEPRLRDRGAEFALYVAGDDQLPRALAKVGFAADTERFVVVGEKARDRGSTLAALGLAEDPTAYPRPVDEGLLDRLGIVPAERTAVPRAMWEGLVLERVALLDLSPPAKSGGGPTARD
jgi:tRNA threonylcarbamoyladenosine modification (KEOPS) complex Cgi121 subunit